MRRPTQSDSSDELNTYGMASMLHSIGVPGIRGRQDSLVDIVGDEFEPRVRSFAHLQHLGRASLTRPVSLLAPNSS